MKADIAVYYSAQLNEQRFMEDFGVEWDEALESGDYDQRDFEDFVLDNVDDSNWRTYFERIVEADVEIEVY